MGQRPTPTSTAALAIRRAAIGAFVGAALILCYVLFGSEPDVRPAMLVITIVMLAVPAVGLLAPVWFRHRWSVTWPAALLSYVNLVGSVLLAHLDGGAATVMGFTVLPGLALVAIVMNRRRLFVFGVLSVGLYLHVAAAGEPAPSGYVLVYTLSFVMLAVVSAQHAEALRGVRRRLAQMADIDPLTHCLNRGAFDRRLEVELAGAARRGDPVSVLLFDLDDFKQVNDAHGHGAGDELLRWTGATLRGRVRPHDVVGRVGGDEFAVLLTEGDDDVAATAERLRAALQERVGTSVGHATWPVDLDSAAGAGPPATTGGAGDWAAGVAEALRHRGDERLYVDKRDRAARSNGARPLDAVGAVPAVPAAASETRMTAGSLLTPPSPDASLSRPGRLAGLRRRLVVRGEDRWRLVVVQTGLVGVLSFTIGIWYVTGYSARPGDPWMTGSAIAGIVVSVLMVVLAARIVRMRRRRSMLTAFQVAVLALGVVLIVRDGGVGSPAVYGLLNAIPLTALGAPPRIAVPLVGALTTTYVVIALALGAGDGWMVMVHLAAFLMVGQSYGAHARYAARQRRRLREASRTDALTGCLNRRGFEDGFAAAISRAQRTGAPASLVVLDLDGFKAVNDTAGHRAGDELLRWVGARLRAESRALDSVGRLGGDEFAMVLPDTDRDGAVRLAERLTAVLGQRTACSVGTATWGEGDDTEVLHLRADRALYAEKVRRRDAVVDVPV